MVGHFRKITDSAVPEDPIDRFHLGSTHEETSVNDKEAWGGPAEMSAWEALMWRAESDPRTRSTGMLLEILDQAPEWNRFVAAHERTVQEIPRLRDRVVVPPVPLVQPVWSPDPEFDLDHHVRTLELPSPGSHRQLLDLCESVLEPDLDPNRPPWQSFLVTGLEGGRAALAFKLHHSLSDGMGLIQLLSLAHSSSRQPSRATLAAVPFLPDRPSYSSTSLLGTTLRKRILGGPQELTRRAAGVTGLVRQIIHGPTDVMVRGVTYAQSLKRVLTPSEIGRSPLLAGSGTGVRLLTVDVPLAELKAAGKLAGCSINDAFMAGFLGGMRRYHEHHGSPVDVLLIGMPISIRQESDAGGGNKFAPARFAAPMSEPDPVARMKLIADFVRTARGEAAMGFLDHVSPVLSKLPSSTIIEITAGLASASDFQVSNIKGIESEVFLAGAKVLGMYALAPRPGVAGTLAMVTYNGSCCLGFNVDPEVFTDLDVFESCIREGFDEVLATDNSADPTQSAQR